MTNLVSGRLILTASIFFLVLISDQITKVLVLGASFNFSCNTGFAFGVFQKAPSVVVALEVLLLSVVAFFLLGKRSMIETFSLALIFGGGVSNLLDRIARGCVLDFIDIGFGPVRWPAFNLADTAITMGVIIIIFSIVRSFRPGLST